MDVGSGMEGCMLRIGMRFKIFAHMGDIGGRRVGMNCVQLLEIQVEIGLKPH